MVIDAYVYVAMRIGVRWIESSFLIRNRALEMPSFFSFFTAQQSTTGKRRIGLRSCFHEFHAEAEKEEKEDEDSMQHDH